MRRRIVTILIFLLAGAAVNVAVAWSLAIGVPAPAPSVAPDQEGHYLDQRTGARWWCQVKRGLGHTQVVFEPVLIRREPTAMSGGDVVVATRDVVESRLDDAWRSRRFFGRIERSGIDLNKLKARNPAEMDKFRAAAMKGLGDRNNSGPAWVEPDALPRWARSPEEVSCWLQIRSGRGWPTAALWHEATLDSTGQTRVLGGWEPPEWSRVSGHILAYRVMPRGFAINTAFHAAVLGVVIYGPYALRRLIRRKRGLCPACAYPMGEAAVCTECGKALPGRAGIAE